MTPSGIEPATFRFVAQHLNHWLLRPPPQYFIVRLHIVTMFPKSYFFNILCKHGISPLSFIVACVAKLHDFVLTHWWITQLDDVCFTQLKHVAFYVSLVSVLYRLSIDFYRYISVLTQRERHTLKRTIIISDRCCRKYQNTHFMLNNFSPSKMCRLWDNVEKYGMRGRPQMTI